MDSSGRATRGKAMNTYDQELWCETEQTPGGMWCAVIRDEDGVAVAVTPNWTKKVEADIEGNTLLQCFVRARASATAGTQRRREGRRQRRR